MKVAAYTPGIMEPSARARIRQFIDPLAQHGIVVKEYPLPYGSSQPKSRALLPVWAAATLGSRLASLAKGQAADVSWVLRQLLPAYLSIESLVKSPIVLDVDDAIWLNRGGHRVAQLARSAHTVVCGNNFLANTFCAWNSNVVVIPTAVDTISCIPGNAAGDGPDGIMIGWTGTSVNFEYLYSLEDALIHVFDRYTQVNLLVVADRAPEFRKLPTSRVEFVRWTPQVDKSSVARMSIGVMPLKDSEWARGKCSYKMLCYMAAYLPVVVSPVGMNSEVLARGNIGYGASNTPEWIDSLSHLIENRSLRLAMGEAGRGVVESEFSLNQLAGQYAAVFQSATHSRVPLESPPLI